MTYNNQAVLAQEIRSRYTVQEPSKLDILRAMDAKVHRPANLFAGVFASISALIMGAGMSLIMTDIGAVIGMSDTWAYGLVIGIIGMLMLILTYPMYKGILNRRQKKYADEIMKLSDEIINK